MAIGRVSGSLLVSNLDRQGYDLQFTTNNNALLYMDFSRFRLGVNTNVTSQTLTINGNLSTSNLVFTSSNISTKAGETLYLTGTVHLGNVGNVKILGGSPNNVLHTDGNGNISWDSIEDVISNSGLKGNVIALGTNTLGSFTSNAVTFLANSTVTNGIAQLNEVLGKLIPPRPPTFPSTQSITITSTITLGRMTNFVQTDNTVTGGHNVAAGTTVTGLRTSGYSTSTINDTGPGESGNVGVYVNGLLVGSRLLTAGSDNGTYGELIISDNVDYGTKTGANQGFWESLDVHAAGVVTEGWNEVYLYHTAGTPTNTAHWYYDASTPGTPEFSATSIVLSSNVVSYTSTIPHLTTAAGVTISYGANRLSGDTYPTGNTFSTGTAGGAITAPSSVTYAQAGITIPLARNLYVSSGSASVTTTANIISGFGSSAAGPSVAVANGYATGTQSFAPGVTVLYKTGTSNQIEETSMSINASVGSGTGNPYRILNPGSSDTPTHSASTAAFNSQTSTLQTYDATVVGAVLKHDQTNYSTGYWPVGPDLSSGRSSAQYYTFKFIRSAVSKFDIKYTGTISGLWVSLPGSTISSTSSLNGWIDMGTAYAGAGVPGANAGGNGSNGCALSGVAVFNTAQTNKSVTCTFGTVSSSSTATNEIYVRVKLTSGQTVTALSIEAATH